MKNVRVVLEYVENGASSMRWERVDAEPCGAYALLGRAFEVARQEDGTRLAPAMAAFFKGAMVAKQDIEELLPDLE